MATHRRRFGSRRPDRGDPRTPLARLARNPGAWGNSAGRAQAPTDLRPHLDPDVRDELRAVWPAWVTLPGQYAGAVARPALTAAVPRGRAVVADATVLAARHVDDTARRLPGGSPCWSPSLNVLPAARASPLLVLASAGGHPR